LTWIFSNGDGGGGAWSGTPTVTVLRPDDPLLRPDDAHESAVLSTAVPGPVDDPERLADELPIEQVAQRWIVASDPDEVVQQLQPYLDAGFNHFVVHGPGQDQERFLTQFTADVLPLLRKLG